MWLAVCAGCGAPSTGDTAVSPGTPSRDDPPATTPAVDDATGTWAGSCTDDLAVTTTSGGAYVYLVFESELDLAEAGNGDIDGVWTFTVTDDRPAPGDGSATVGGVRVDDEVRLNVEQLTTTAGATKELNGLMRFTLIQDGDTLEGGLILEEGPYPDNAALVCSFERPPA